MSEYDYTPPAVNLKCIVFTAALASGYWFLPSRNKYVLIALAYFPYLALAWYDWIYACQHNFGPTYLAHFYSWAKPQNSRQIVAYKNWAPSIKNKVLAVDVVLALSLLLLLPSFLSWKPKKKTDEEERQANNIAIGALIVVLLVFVWLRFTH
jgi:hypothetical protein